MRELQEIEFVLRVKLGTYRPEDIVERIWYGNGGIR